MGIEIHLTCDVPTCGHHEEFIATQETAIKVDEVYDAVRASGWEVATRLFGKPPVLVCPRCHKLIRDAQEKSKTSN